MKKIVFSILLLQLTCMSASAAGYSNAAIPTQIDVERGEGFAIYGDFGNPGGCTNVNVLFVRSNSPHYKEMYAAALSAFTGRFRLQAYVVNCQTITWYTVAPNTLNIVDANSVLNIIF